MRYDLMTPEYIVRNGQPMIILFARNENRERESIGIRGFKPYFYAPFEEQENDIFFRPISRIETILPRDVPKERAKHTFHDEADILFPWRFLIDRKIKCGFTLSSDITPSNDLGIPPRIIYFDIEVMSPPEIMPKPEKPNYPIVTIQCFDSYEEKITCLVLGHMPTVEFPIPIEIKEYETEQELIRGFVNYVKELDADVLTGWASNFFDFPYIIRRARKLRVNIQDLSPLGKVDLGDRDVRIKGREAIDMLAIYKAYKMPTGQMESYDLKFIAEVEADFVYTDYGDQIEELYNNDRETLMNYIVRDAYVLHLLDKKVGLFEFYDNVRRIAGLPFHKAHVYGQVIDYLMLRLRNRPLPSKNRSKKDFDLKGAIVLEPEPKLHHNIGVFDLKSIYPSIILAYNISPETNVTHLSDDEIRNIGDVNVVEIACEFGTYRFRTDIEGLLPVVVQYLLEQRELVREDRKKFEPHSPEWETLFRKEFVLKFLVCSVYGVNAYQGFRMFSPDVANSITGAARECIRVLITTAIENGYGTVYGDTDSLFIQLKNEKDGYKLEQMLQQRLNEIAKEMRAQFPLTIKYEKFYKVIFFKQRAGKRGEGAKKLYAGLLVMQDGISCFHIHLIGLAPRRSDTARITRKTMSEFFEILFLENDPESAIRYLQSVIDSYSSLPLTEIGIPKGLQKDDDEYLVTNPWLEGKQYSEKKFNIKFRQDHKPKLIYVRNEGIKAICITDQVELPIDVDYETMIEKTLRNKFEDILINIGHDWGEILTNTRQTSMEGFV